VKSRQTTITVTVDLLLFFDWWNLEQDISRRKLDHFHLFWIFVIDTNENLIIKDLQKTFHYSLEIISLEYVREAIFFHKNSQKRMDFYLKIQLSVFKYISKESDSMQIDSCNPSVLTAKIFLKSETKLFFIRKY